MARERGLICSRNNFWLIIRNPLYCGKIFISQFKDEESYFVKGRHEPIISESAFYEVQDVLSGRGKQFRPKYITRNEFPLRVFLICPACDKALTGSKSKGRSKHYAYYHCVKECKHRVHAEIINEAIADNLMKLVPKIGNASILEEIIAKQYAEQTKDIQGEKKQILFQIKEYENRLSHTRDLLATRQIEASDYRDMKFDYGAKTTSLELKLTQLRNEGDDVRILINRGVSKVIELREYIKDKNLAAIRKEVGSIYPEKLVFSKSGVRTTRRNEFIRCVSLINNELCKIKNGTKIDFSTLSRQVPTKGILIN